MWAQIINALLGLWLMTAPVMLDSEKTASNNGHIVGPIIVSFAVIAWWESTRVVRLYNLPLGAWLLLAPWVLGYENTPSIVNNLAVGALVIAFSLVRGKVQEQFGGGWGAVFRSDTPHARAAREKPQL
ncbi:SPW repeat protein [Rufibacter ruber]|uniref:SPW repeat protein n=1 Tax=Rufibacter ruber TaxID=1783499 RepID=UPI0008356291|nr:SPW repeat protein [Rufibacter ruber]